MLQLVWEKHRSRTADNHGSPGFGIIAKSYITTSSIITYVKLLYYQGIAVLYGVVGCLPTMVMVNSTWTYQHVKSLWIYAAFQKRIRIVYPPCSLPQTPSFELHHHTNMNGTPKPTNFERYAIILSIGQFRPEKDHALQIKAMALYLNKYHPAASIGSNNPAHEKEIDTDAFCASKTMYPQLVLIGSCRNLADEQRLEALRKLCCVLNIERHVHFVVNEPFAIVQEYFYKSSIGIHTVRFCNANENRNCRDSTIIAVTKFMI
jgi:alpha-1,2-mannosyltransferase